VLILTERKMRAALRVVAACRGSWDYVRSTDDGRDHLYTLHLWRLHPKMRRISLPSKNMA
jgi:hypothetical protein